ncbi:MAG: protoporphyrinogen oxidase [Planctomycetota bacterium]
MNIDADVLVVGGGITGLTAAYRLRSHGQRVVVAEASDHVGGVIRSEQVEGLLLEHGPFSVMLRSPEFRRLIEELGLHAVEVDADASKRRYVQHRGRLHALPSSPRALVMSPLLSPLGKLRLVSGMIRSKRPGRDDEASVHEAATRRFGVEASERLAGPACVGIFAAESDELGLAACMPKIADADQDARSGFALLKAASRSGPRERSRTMLSFEGGLGAMIAALERELREQILTRCPVTTLRRSDDGRGFFAEVGEHGVRTDAVVVTTGAVPSAGVIADIVPDAARELRTIRYADLGVVHLVFDREHVGHPLDGFGYLVSRNEKHADPVLGCIWPASVFPEHSRPGTAVVRVMLGGTRWPGTLDADDDALIKSALASIGPVLRITDQPRLARVVRWPSSVPIYEVGHVTRVASIQRRIEAVPGLTLAGSWVCGPEGGLGVNDRIRHAWSIADRIHGSLVEQSQDAAAQTRIEGMVPA